MVEHWSPKPGAAGSSPVSPASIIKALRGFIFLFILCYGPEQK